ncbi:MAG: hypothetical protein ACFFC7_00095 [Candidatus Hermodarchaeota archaeon]
MKPLKLKTLCIIPFRGTIQCKTRLKINNSTINVVDQLAKSLFLEAYRLLTPFFTKTIILTKEKSLIQNWFVIKKPQICEDLSPTLNGSLEDIIKSEVDTFDYLTIVLPDLPLLVSQDVAYLLDNLSSKKYSAIIGRSKDNGTNMFSISSKIVSKIALNFGVNSFYYHSQQFKSEELLTVQDGWAFDLDTPQDVLNLANNTLLFNQLPPSIQKLAYEYIGFLSPVPPFKSPTTN